MGVVYLVSVLAGKEVETSAARKQVEMGSKIFNVIKGLGIGDVVKSANLDFRHAIMWIIFVCSFFELGMENGRKGIALRIYMSW